jgi:hypothetical protein
MAISPGDIDVERDGPYLLRRALQPALESRVTEPLLYHGTSRQFGTSSTVGDLLSRKAGSLLLAHSIHTREHRF